MSLQESFQPVALQEVERMTKELAGIKDVVAPAATNEELYIFSRVSLMVGLNPFLHEIMFLKYKNKQSGTNNVSYYVGRDGYLALAKKDPKFRGILSYPVYQKDFFEIEMDTSKAGNMVIKHKPLLMGEPGGLIGAYAVLENDYIHTYFLSVAECANQIAGSNSQWRTNTLMMLKKEAERRLLKNVYSIPSILTTEGDLDMIKSDANLEIAETPVVKAPLIKETVPVEIELPPTKPIVITEEVKIVEEVKDDTPPPQEDAIELDFSLLGGTVEPVKPAAPAPIEDLLPPEPPKKKVKKSTKAKPVDLYEELRKKDFLSSKDINDFETDVPLQLAIGVFNDLPSPSAKTRLQAMVEIVKRKSKSQTLFKAFCDEVQKFVQTVSKDPNHLIIFQDVFELRIKPILKFIETNYIDKELEINPDMDANPEYSAKVLEAVR